MPHVYPLMLDVTDRLVVIVGGGAVAVRKAKGLLECGATRVRCVAPTIAPGMPDSVDRVNEKYEPRHLDGTGLVFAATDDPAINAAVVRDARSRGVLVNRADAEDDDAPGDFATPARLTESGVTVTVSAGSPALSTLVRDGIRANWDARWSRMAEAMQAIRPEITRLADVPQTRRRDIFRELATDDALDVVAAGGVGALRDWLAAKFPEFRR